VCQGLAREDIELLVGMSEGRTRCVTVVVGICARGPELIVSVGSNGTGAFFGVTPIIGIGSRLLLVLQS
jgi:hypothetical protein